MGHDLKAFVGADVFDGSRLFKDHALLVCGAKIKELVPAVGIRDFNKEAEIVELDGGTIAPGYVDLQVNGGGGVMFNDDPCVEALALIARAHVGLGATSILPTLITDTPENTRAAIKAVERACAQGVAGIVGLHLEGPHLCAGRKGAHNPALIRSMEAEDLALLMDAAARLPVLKVTLAPENVTPEQMRLLSSAGVILSLGHSNASYAECEVAVQHGAVCVTHVFNAMSPLGSREPGLVGAALGLGELSAGLIADMVHVHPQSIALALRGMRGPGHLFLVSDAMATAGSKADHFFLNNRRIQRTAGRLTLEDGTLAGADLDLSTAVRNLVDVVGVPFTQALGMATLMPAQVIRQNNALGRIAKGRQADLLYLDNKKELKGVWHKGLKIVQSPLHNGQNQAAL